MRQSFTADLVAFCPRGDVNLFQQTCPPAKMCSLHIQRSMNRPRKIIPPKSPRQSWHWIQCVLIACNYSSACRGTSISPRQGPIFATGTCFADSWDPCGEKVVALLEKKCPSRRYYGPSNHSWWRMPHGKCPLREWSRPSTLLPCSTEYRPGTSIFSGAVQVLLH